MPLPRVQMDFNTNSLGNCWTVEDLKRQRISLHEGMRLILWQADAEEGENGFLHTAANIWWDARDKVFRIDLRTVDFQFTPGNDVKVVDEFYAKE